MAENTGKNKGKKGSACGQKKAAADADFQQQNTETLHTGETCPAEDHPEAPEESGINAASSTADQEGAQELNEEATAATEEKELQNQISELNKNMCRLNEEKQELEQKFVRLQADFDNFRRRKARESEEQIKNAAANLMASLLPVLDNFQRAVAAMGDSPDKEGVALIQKQLQSVLEQSGLTLIEALGEDFDPNIHEAVMQTDAGEENRGKVVMEIQKGYMLNGKLLRASMVQVGS